MLISSFVFIDSLSFHESYGTTSVIVSSFAFTDSFSSWFSSIPVVCIGGINCCAVVAVIELIELERLRTAELDRLRTAEELFLVTGVADSSSTVVLYSPPSDSPLLLLGVLGKLFQTVLL